MSNESHLVKSLKARMLKYDFRDVTEPKNGYILCKDHYWLCENGDEKQALFILDAPFCNTDINVMEWGMLNYIKCGIENVKPVLIPIAYIKNKQ